MKSTANCRSRLSVSTLRGLVQNRRSRSSERNLGSRSSATAAIASYPAQSNVERSWFTFHCEFSLSGDCSASQASQPYDALHSGQANLQVFWAIVGTVSILASSPKKQRSAISATVTILSFLLRKEPLVLGLPYRNIPPQASGLENLLGEFFWFSGAICVVTYIERKRELDHYTHRQPP